MIKFLSWLKTWPIMAAFMAFGLVIFCYGGYATVSQHIKVGERGMVEHELSIREVRNFGAGLIIFGLAILTVVLYLFENDRSPE